MKEAEGLSGQAETTTTTTKETRVPSRKGVSSPTKRVQELLKKRSDSGSKSTSTSPGKVVKAASQDLMKEYKRAWRVGYASMFFYGVSCRLIGSWMFTSQSQLMDGKA